MDAKELIDKPSTGDPIKSHSLVPIAFTHLLYVMLPDELPETIMEEKSFEEEFNVTVPSLDMSPLTVKSAPEFKLRLILI